MEFPHLPEERVKLVLTGADWAGRLEEPLRQRGIGLLTLSANIRVDSPVRSHADLLLQSLGGDVWVAEPDSYQEACGLLVPRGQKVIKGQTRLGKNYPQDIPYNGLLLGGCYFHKVSSTDPVVLEELERRGIKIRPVKQGYGKCSVAVLGSHGAITADPGMARAMEQEGIEVLTIRPGGIALPGYDTGFIGGSCFLSAPDTLTLTGRFDHHPDWGRFLSFLRHLGLRADLLTGEPLFDVGSILIVE